MSFICFHVQQTRRLPLASDVTDSCSLPDNNHTVCAGQFSFWLQISCCFKTSYALLSDCTRGTNDDERRLRLRLERHDAMKSSQSFSSLSQSEVSNVISWTFPFDVVEVMIMTSVFKCLKHKADSCNSLINHRERYWLIWSLEGGQKASWESCKGFNYGLVKCVTSFPFLVLHNRFPPTASSQRLCEFLISDSCRGTQRLQTTGASHLSG